MNRSYTPGTCSIDISAPGGVEALLALHRGIFGGFRMTEGSGTEGGEGAAGGTGSTGTGGAAGKVEEVGENGFPEKTPVKDMTGDQQVAYWKHQARKHEDRVKTMSDYDALKAERDELKSKTQTADEKAIDAAKAEAATAATTAERAKLAPKLVAAEFKAINAGRIDVDKMKDVLDGLDYTKFLTPEGDADADKVKRFVDGIAPADGKRKWPDMGQGRRSSQKTTGVDAGRALFTDRRPASK
jgi:hypothetical protein